MENNIPSGNYIGYLWHSDASEPKQYSGDVASIDFNAFPFIAEGMLWDEEKKTTIMINYTHRLNIAIYENVSTEKTKIYMGHKTSKFKEKNIRMVTIWEEVPDPLCAGMNVLTPKANVFVGFVSSENK